MDFATEYEQPPKKHVVRLGEDFTLLDQNQEVKYTSFDQSKYYESTVVLDLNNLGGILPFAVRTRFIGGLLFKAQTITPFDPNDGYVITQEDFDLTKRKEKLQTQYNTNEGNIHKAVGTDYKNIPQVDYKNNPFKLSVWGFMDQFDIGRILFEHGLEEQHASAEGIDKEQRDIIKRLRFQIQIPVIRPDGISYNLFFESTPEKPERHVNDPKTNKPKIDGSIQFAHFYPVDTGPMAHRNNSILFEHGLDLAFPDDLNKLRKITGKFIMLKETNKTRSNA